MSEADAPIQIEVYHPEWPERFVAERVALNRVLSRWLAGPIEHIGSTAVPSLDAKPVIDIMAGVAGLDESRSAIGALRNLNYMYAPYRNEVMHWFCKPAPSFRTHHLHLVPFMSDLWRAQLVFRDRLREDQDLAAEYLRLKLRLAASFEHDRDAYTEGKSEFVARVIGGGSG